MSGLIDLIVQLIVLLIFVRILMSWLPMAGIRIDSHNPIVRSLIQVTDVFLEPFQRLIPPVGGMDLSPIIAIFAIQFVGQFLAQLFRGF
ncbi:MAG: YggT family protein [Ardenticatenaceae bacterium]